MRNRGFWRRQLEGLCEKRSVVWLPGVRRSGKTTLCRSLEEVEYFDCELPRQRRMMEDPEGFLGSLQGKRIVLDEIHRLRNPSELLKIAADHYPRVKVIATGSSTLGATRKFRDSLTGRKAELWLTPAMSQDLEDLGVDTLSTRLYRGGLPPFLLNEQTPESDFQSWIDDYWAKDIQELFRLERRSSFLQFVELLLVASGGIFEATRFAAACEVSRPTITNYLSVLETTYVAHVVRPFSTRKSVEIVSAPKVYGFDTGFVCYFRGWHHPRPDDLGVLWEHYVLNEIHARLQSRRVHYWRDKHGHEVDFIIAPPGKPPTAIECKWSADRLEPAALRAFVSHYPKARCLVVCQDVVRTYERVFGDVKAQFISLRDLIEQLSMHPV